jgi:uncharacterized protein YecT (DUF1311 family)
MFLLIGVVLLSSVITLISTAYGDDLSTQYRDCVNRTTSNYDWGQCGGHAVARQDARLNTAWKTALKCFDDSDQTQKDAKQALIEEERLWIIWKEKACNFYFPQNDSDSPHGFAGREGQVLDAASCRAGIIADRARFFEDFAKDCQ